MAFPPRIAIAIAQRSQAARARRGSAPDWPVTWILTIHDHDAPWPEVEETGDTYLENALLKARAVAAALGEPAMADDSGIEVDALGGKPGPRSARFAGEDATDEQNLRALIQALAGVPSGGRSARYRCVAAIAWPDGRELHAEGVCEGTLIGEARGEPADSATTRSSCRPAGTRRWPSSPPSRRTASATAAGRSGRCRRPWKAPPSPVEGPYRPHRARTSANYPTQGRRLTRRRICSWVKRLKPEPRRVLRVASCTAPRDSSTGSPLGAVYAVGLSFTVVLLVLDCLSGARISFSLFYLMPIGLVTWNLGRSAGIGTAFDLHAWPPCSPTSSARARSTTWSRTGTPLGRFAVFVAFAVLLATLKETLVAQRQRVEREHEVSSGLREMNEVKDTLLHAVSHDLKGPLAGIIGAMSTLRRGNELQLTGDEVESLYQMIEQSGRKMNRLIDDMLDLERSGPWAGATRA